ncbi:response regulator [Thalassobaculum salexigens]|uniref:response regulator n=1 Tax=Thalassobaculum salexigens TaxID=455360 RepID=UPI00248EECD1|nr:response regulator [Thalassobaculum salexigens]
MTKICLVEDDPDLRENLAVVLGRADYDVRTASNGVHAIPMLLDWRPDMVVCDMLMPDGEGFEVLRSVQSTLPDTSFVMMSGAIGEVADVLEAARLLGADAILRKPFTPDELLETLARLRDQARTAVNVSAT